MPASAACEGGFSVVGEADAGPTAELEEVRFVRVRTWVDEAHDAGGDTHPFSVVAPSCWRSRTVATTGLAKDELRRQTSASSCL